MNQTPRKRHKPAPRDGLSYGFGLFAIGIGAIGLWLAYDALQATSLQTAPLFYNGKFSIASPMFVFLGLNVLIRGPSGIDVLNTPGEEKPSKLNLALMILSLAAGFALAAYVNAHLDALGYARDSIFS